ncbi:MAG: protein phosphatase CheZ [Alphaproteobacteria bacterium]|nr:protein phosphatase CheZ [Alphaproteobacteria bacterium]
MTLTQPSSPTAPLEPLEALAQKLLIMEKFIARRFDEISMEINATSQQVDMAEEGIARRFGEILEVMKAISYHGDGSSPANAGVELDAVVETTEKAANQILDAADRIASKLRDVQDWSDETKRKEALDHIQEDIEQIFLACSFQDITGQRIRKTLENLKMIEDRIEGALSKLGIKIDGQDAKIIRAVSQDEIDQIFGN